MRKHGHGYKPYLPFDAANGAISITANAWNTSIPCGYLTFQENVMSRSNASTPRNWIGWILTGLMAALMLLSALPDILLAPTALSVFAHLGYPPYLLLFLGTAKILGVIGVLVPGIPDNVKEWAFAGLTFDVTGALYSHLSVGDPPGAWAPAVIGLVLIGGTYATYRLRRRATVPHAVLEPAAAR